MRDQQLGKSGKNTNYLDTAKRTKSLTDVAHHCCAYVSPVHIAPYSIVRPEYSFLRSRGR